MSASSIFDPVIDTGIRNANFFEGRLLTADTLRDEQKAQRERQWLLGRAIGSGVAEGLTVKIEQPASGTVSKTVTIAKGHAINRRGEVLWLREDFTADIIPPTVAPEAPTTLFSRCGDAATPQPSVSTGVGIYILVMSPASGYRERAPKSGLGSEGKITGCGDRYVVDGVQFRVERLNPENISAADGTQRAEITLLLNQTTDPAKRSLLRNLIAHYCFGGAQTADFAVDPFARADGASKFLAYGALDDLRGLGRLTDCDVPLALLLWNDSGIAFLDLWAARRRPIPPPVSADWPLVSGERSSAEGESRFLQFQAHLADLMDELPAPANAKALDYFRYLPPAGLLRIAGPQPKGLSVTTFFQGVTVRFPRPPRFDAADGPVFMDGARMQALIRDSVRYPAVDMSTREAVWLYRVRENRLALDTQPATGLQTVVVFAGGQLPYYGSPRFDVSAWDYSNYSSVQTGPGGL